MITQKQLDQKYAPETPWWRKDPVERFICEKHGESTIFIRDSDMVLHANSDSECY